MARMIDADALMVWLVNMLNEFDDGNDPHEIKREMFQIVLAKTRKMPTVDSWVSVKDRLPELTRQVESDDFLIDYSEDVVVLSERRNHLPQIGRYAREGLRERWEDKDYDPIPDVTHWMPLPEPPKEDNDAEQ